MSMDFNQLNFSSQESLFPQIPPNVNPWDQTINVCVFLDRIFDNLWADIFLVGSKVIKVNYFGKHTDSDAMLAQYCIAIIILVAYGNPRSYCEFIRR